MSPLPPVVETYYTIGGCWNLALALHERTGFPIEVFYRNGGPTHASVVDGDFAIDARGRNPLELVRRASERTRVVSAEELLVVLASEAEGGPAAAAAADILLAAI